MLRIVHLSDIHYNGKDLIDIKQFMIKALINDLYNINNDRKIDIIIITGDLIDKAGDGFEDILTAFLSFEENIIEPILTEINLPKGRFFMVPGNHDIERKADNEVIELGLQSYLNTPDKINNFMDTDSPEGISRMLPFKDFEKAFYSPRPKDSFIGLFNSCYKLIIDDKKVGITCFNSAWRSYDSDSDKKRIILGERQVTNARLSIEDCDIKIAAIHHPLDWLADYDQLSGLIQKDYDILLCGHVHGGTSWTRSDMFGELFISVAPQNWTYNIRSNDRLYSNGYSIIDYDLSNMEITIHNRRYSHAKECFDPNTDLGDEHGICHFYLADQQALIKQNYESIIVESIKKLHYDELNEHLISYNAETKAPKNLNDLFVMPCIVSNIEYDIEKMGEDNIYNIESICKHIDNIIIFGTKESGKTILLDRVLIEFTENMKIYHRIPIYIDFDEVGNRKFEAIIKNYLGEDFSSLKELHGDKFVLLIDNLSFDKINIHKLKRLAKFINDNNNIKIISTCNQVFEGEIPLDLLEYPFFEKFKTLYIRGFRTKEIKQLINKWFSDVDYLETPGKLDKVIKVFVTLNLPRTPLAISMFLWIIEEQENYKPINNATMLEHYIERLFKKLGKKEIYTDQFDYKNKERLLAEIAYLMFEVKLENYRVKLPELIIFIRDYIIGRKFEFDSDEVFGYFIEKGIFVKENDGFETFVRFRFTCFFEYFLMKKMEYDHNFREYVFSEENYLKFGHEIDYYTGIKRDQSEILCFVINKMMDEFKELIEKISELGNYDKFYKIKESIVSNLNVNSFMEKLEEVQKPDEEQLEKIHDNMLETIKPERGITKKEGEINFLKKLEFLWTLSAQVLKNTEEIEIEDLKANSYKSILECCMAFTTIYKIYIEYHLIKYGDKITKNIKDGMILFGKCLPLAAESVLYFLMGTAKMNVVIREKIEKDKTNKAISGFEKFISVFLYADIGGSQFLWYIKDYLKNIKDNYIFDISLLKLLEYYVMRSKSEFSDLMYRRLIADLLIRSGKYTGRQKGEIMESYKKKKKRLLSENLQLKLF